jgi:beta-galactosidase
MKSRSPDLPLPAKSSHLWFGGDYNPEQWPEETWIEDVALMREAGVNLATVAVFAWSKINPAPGVFEFGWLDRLMDLLHAHGIGVCLATATASPPAWLTIDFPDSRAVNASALPLHHGSRQNYSPNSPSYQRFARELVQAMADRYAQHPALIFWHINNEYMCHTFESYSEHDAAAFRKWLQERYGSLETLNEAWGAAFWSQLYHDWDHVMPPMIAPYLGNPTQALDYRRFMNDSFLALYRMEKDILREKSPEIPITTNFIGLYKNLDQFGWADDLDVASWDAYPDPGVDLFGFPMGHDLTRSLKGGRPFLLMEQAAGQVNWRPINRNKRPGEMRLQSLQAVARGADGVLFFQWRQSRTGGEMYHSAMLPHVGAERSRIFSEIKSLGRELKLLEPVAGSRVRAETAILMDWSNWWALEGEGKIRRFDYSDLLRKFHQPLYDENLTCDVIPPGSDLSGYRLIVVPFLYMLAPSAAKQLTEYVARGGRLLVSCFTGVVDENHHAQLGGYPAHLREVLGLWTEFWEPLPDGESYDATWVNSREHFTLSCLQETVHLEGAEALAEFEDGPAARLPAITAHTFGKGMAAYVAGVPCTSALRRVVRHLLPSPAINVPAGVELTERVQPDGRRFLFVLNFNATPVVFEPGALPRGIELLTGSSTPDRLDPLDAMVLALESPADT